MAFVKIVRPKCEKCIMPMPSDTTGLYSPGTIWSCDECGQHWRMVYGSTWVRVEPHIFPKDWNWDGNSKRVLYG